MSNLDDLARSVEETLQRSRARTGGGTSEAGAVRLTTAPLSLRDAISCQRVMRDDLVGELARLREQRAERERAVEGAKEQCRILLEQAELYSLRVDFVRQRRVALERRAKDLREQLDVLAEERREAARAVLQAHAALVRVADRLKAAE